MSKDNQLALVVEAATASTALIGRTGFVPVEVVDTARLYDPVSAHFMTRGRVETDESYKQLIPYAILVTGGKVLTYTRAASGGEDRLHGKLSFGVGGHIDPSDSVLVKGVLDVSETVSLAGEREIAEEVPGGLGAVSKNVPLGFIYDDTEPVGRVHLGVVEVLFLEDLTATEFEADLENGKLCSLDYLESQADRLENWSALVLPALRALLPAPPVM